jgi:N-acetylglucosamine-6-phosphate deacetylase
VTSRPSKLVFEDVQLATAEGVLRGWLTTDGSKIADLGPGDPPEAALDHTRFAGHGGLLLPGFIDVHTHGAVGHEVMDGSAEGLREITRFLATRGVTSFLATTWTSSHERTLAALDAARSAIGEDRHADAASLIGVHLEGPYLNTVRAGAQDPEHIRPADPAEAAAYLDSGVVRLMTLAPEIPANEWLLEELVARGITASAGHTDATFEQMQRAVERGLRHVTHTFNAMRPFHHRDPGTVGAALLIDELRCELIADGLHVDPVAMRLLANVRGPEAVILVSDAVRPTGLGDGEYRLDHRVVRVSDGAVRLPDGGFAGSILTLDRALRNLAAATGREAAELWPASSGAAAVSAGVEETKGRIAPGFDADLVLLDQDLEVRMTVVEGTVAYDGTSISTT